MKILAHCILSMNRAPRELLHEHDRAGRCPSSNKGRTSAGHALAGRRTSDVPARLRDGPKADASLLPPAWKALFQPGERVFVLEQRGTKHAPQTPSHHSPWILPRIPRRPSTPHSLVATGAVDAMFLDEDARASSSAHGDAVQARARPQLSEALKDLLSRIALDWKSTSTAATELAAPRYPLTHIRNLNTVMTVLGSVDDFHRVATGRHAARRSDVQEVDLSDFPQDSPVWSELQAALEDEERWDGAHPIVRWCVACCQVRSCESDSGLDTPVQDAALRYNFYHSRFHGNKHILLANKIRSYERKVHDTWATAGQFQSQKHAALELRYRGKPVPPDLPNVRAPWYGRVLPIIQSSGMGKSRLMRQLGGVEGFTVLMIFLRKSECRPAHPLGPVPTLLSWVNCC